MTKTNQELFNIAYIGIASQGFNPANDGLNCLYRAPNGRKCAIGWNIPDEAYEPAFENKTLKSADLDYVGGRICAAADIGPKQVNFALLLQKTHDSSYHANPIRMQAALLEFARQYQLAIPDIPTEQIPTPQPAAAQPVAELLPA